MRALVVRQGRLSLETGRAEPRPAPGEIRVAVSLAGICATDLEILGGYMGFEGVVGHEFVGVALDGALAGRRVVGEINAACGRCDRCARGLGRHCADRTVLGIAGRDGAFAEMLVLPETNLRAVPDSVPDDDAVFTEPIAAACEILDQVPAVAGRRAAILGDGRLGLLCGFVLKDAGLDVTLLGKHQEKLDLASRAGITTRLVSGGEEASGLAPFPLVVDATGSAAGLSMALALVEPRGTLVLKTTTHEVPKKSLARIVIDEITVVGSRCGRFEPALAALESRRVRPRVLIADRFPLERGAEAFARAGAGNALKVLLQIGSQR